MSRIVAVHSHRGGVGTTCIAAHLAVHVARAGRRVGIVDLCLGAPDLHSLFAAQRSRSLSDFLADRASIAEAAIDAGSGLREPLPDGGAILLLPASAEPREIARLLHEGLHLEGLAAGLRESVVARGLDVLVLDTPAGLNEETLLAATLADCLLVLLGPDTRHAAATAAALDLLEQLEPPQILIALNQLPPLPDHAAMIEDVAMLCRRPVAAVLPRCDVALDIDARAAPASAADTGFLSGLRRIAELIGFDT